MDDAHMTDNDVAVAPRLQKVPGEKRSHRKTRERKPRGRLRFGRPRASRSRAGRSRFGRFRVGWPGYPVAGLTVLAVLLATATGYLGWSLHNDSDATAERAAIIGAAQREAAAITTLDSKSGASDYNTVLSGLAGDLKQQMSAGRSQFLQTLGTAGASSVGTVLDVGVVSVKGGTATVLVDVKAIVSNKQSAKPEERGYHWQFSLVSSDGKWLVTSLEFI